MKHLTHWILALTLLVPAATLSDAGLGQEPPKAQKEPKQKPPRKEARPPQVGGRQERHAAILKALPELKTSLVEAVALAEKQTAGKAFSAGLEIIKGKPLFQINLFVGEEFTVTNVDPETKLVTVQQRKNDGAKDEGAQQEGGTSEGGG